MEVGHIRVIGDSLPGNANIIDVDSGEPITDVVKLEITHEPRDHALIAILHHAMLIRGDIEPRDLIEATLVDEIRYGPAN